MDFLAVVAAALLFFMAGAAAFTVIFVAGWITFKIVRGLSAIPFVIFALASILVIFALIETADFFFFPGDRFGYQFSFASALGLGGVVTLLRWRHDRQSTSSLSAVLSGIRYDGQRQMDVLSDALIRDVVNAARRE